MNFGFSVEWLNGSIAGIDYFSIEATVWGSVFGKNGSGGWLHVDWAGETGSIVGINHNGFTGNQSNFGCVFANESVSIGNSHRTPPTYVEQFDNVTVHCGDLGIDMHFGNGKTDVLTCRIVSNEQDHRGQVLGGLTFGCVDGCCVPQSHYFWCYGNLTGNHSRSGDHCLDGCVEYVFVRNNSLSSSAPDYCVNKGPKYQDLLLTGVGNFTNLTELCDWNCNGLNCVDGFGCTCSGIPGVKCCQYSNNVTECRILADGNSFWLQHRVEIIVLLIVLAVLVLFCLEVVWCLCGYKNLKKEKWTITNGDKYIEAKGWCFIFVLWLCGFKPSRAIVVGPDDFGRTFFGPDDFGFRINAIGFNSSGYPFENRCCEWKSSTAGGINCCVDYPINDNDPCYTYKQDPTRWDCRSFTTGVAGWNDGCFCENDNTVTWCCSCLCEKLWVGYRFKFGQPFGSGVVFHGNQFVGFSFNSTGTIVTKLANITVSGCHVPEPLDAWFGGGHWLDAHTCSKCVGKSCRPYYGATHCSGRSNWGKVITTCDCPTGGTPQPIGRNVLLMNNKFGVRSVVWSYCDLTFNWREEAKAFPPCNFWCGDWSSGWCNLHVYGTNGSCVVNDTQIHTPVWVFCGDDKSYNGSKCNGTIYVDPSPKPYNPDFPHDDPHDNGAGRFFKDLLEFWTKWHYYIVVFLCFVVCWIIIRIVVCGHFNRQ